MPGQQFLHGAEVLEVAFGGRPITTPASAVIGLVGAASKGPVNTPVLIHGSLKEGVDTFGPPGYGFSIADAIQGITDQAGALIVVINVADPTDNTLLTTVSAAPETFDSTGKIQLTKVAVSSVALTGPVTAPAIFSGATLVLPTGASSPVVKSADGLTTYVVTTDYTFSGHTLTIVGGGAMTNNQAVLVTYTMSGIASPADFTVDGDNGIITLVAGGKIMPKATLDVAYTYLDPTLITDTMVVGGVGNTGAYKGVYALLGAETVVGVKPRILIAPGFMSDRPSGAANPVVAALAGIADRTRSVIIADGPNVDDASAFLYRNDWGSPRIYIVDPAVKWENPVTGAIEDTPASPRVAGRIAATDFAKGFWYSPSNQVLNGVVGTGRQIDFQMGDYASRANVLNQNDIATIIHNQGFRLWGNRTASSDPQWQYLSVRRTADLIEDALMNSVLWAIDQNITKFFVDAVVESVADYLRLLKAEGAIIDGKCWADPDLNTPLAIANGELYIDFDFAPNYPAEHITFRAAINNSYLTEIFAAAA